MQCEVQSALKLVQLKGKAKCSLEQEALIGHVPVWESSRGNHSHTIKTTSAGLTFQALHVLPLCSLSRLISLSSSPHALFSA